MYVPFLCRQKALENSITTVKNFKKNEPKRFPAFKAVLESSVKIDSKIYQHKYLTEVLFDCTYLSEILWFLLFNTLLKYFISQSLSTLAKINFQKLNEVTDSDAKIIFYSRESS